jgi:transcriptional regulator with XRE-family HTH domain
MLPRTETLIVKIKAWCSEKYGRQAELARAIGVSRQTVNFWLRRRSNPTSEQTLALMEFLQDPEAFKKGKVLK